MSEVVPAKPETEINVPKEAAKDTLFEVFFSRIPNSNFIFPNGKLACFVGDGARGRYATDNPAEAAYLQYEIDQGHAYLYRDTECLRVSKEDLQPDAVYRKRVIEEYLAEQAAIASKQADLGTSEQGKLNVADSSVISAGAADSNGVAVSSISGLASLGKK